MIFFFEMDIILFTIAGILFGILNSMIIQANDTISLYFIPKQIKWTVIGILKFFLLGASTLGPLIFGLVGDFIAPFAPLVFFPIMLFVSSFSYWLLIYRNISSKNIGSTSSPSCLPHVLAVPNSAYAFPSGPRRSSVLKSSPLSQVCFI